MSLQTIKAQFAARVATAINDSIKKTYVKVTDKTKRIDIKPLTEAVAEIIEVSMEEAGVMIVTNEVTINSELVTDPNYVLKSGDIIRVEVGHIINDIGYMAIVR